MFSSLQLLLSLLFISVTFATVDWGKPDPNSQYELAYGSKYTSSREFCQKLRLATIDYVGARGYHHTIQCDVNSPASPVYAFCGGVKKQANGDYGKRGSPVVDFTPRIVKSMTEVQILYKPGKSPPITSTFTTTVPASTNSVPSTTFTTSTKSDGKLSSSTTSEASAATVTVTDTITKTVARSTVTKTKTVTRTVTKKR